VPSADMFYDPNTKEAVLRDGTSIPMEQAAFSSAYQARKVYESKATQ